MLPDYERHRLRLLRIARLHCVGAPYDAATGQICAEKCDRMAAEREPDMPVILDDLTSSRHRPQCDVRFIYLRDRVALERGSGKKRQRLVA
jgi:hypothetical protein